MVGMRMGLEMKMSQQLIMTPQLQQAIKLLQLSRVELEELIEQSLVENPTLELKPVEKEDEDNADESETEEPTSLLEEQSQLSYDEDWQNYIESGAGVIQEVRGKVNDSDDMSNFLETTISKSASLMDHLLWQLEISSMVGEEIEIAEYIVGNIDEDGYLSVSVRELLETNPELLQTVKGAYERQTLPSVLGEGVEFRFDLRHETRGREEKSSKKRRDEATAVVGDTDPEEGVGAPAVPDVYCGVVEGVLLKIQKFDPPGVGTRDLRECLENQLILLKLQNSLVFRIVRENMNLLEKKDLKRIARLQKADIQKVVEAYQLITELEPKPGRPFGREVTQYVVPDVFIFRRGNEYVVHMNQDTLPKLRINPYYQKMVDESRNEKSQQQRLKSVEERDMTHQYLQEKIKSGDWLMKSIEQRQKTIFRVAKSILKHQYEFFEKGIDYLKPLVLKDVAEDIDVHESTVSRITTNKYVYTPQGIFELKYFFTSGIDQGDGDVISSKKIKDYIGKLIGSEDKKRPYTDLQIKNELLVNADIKVARRTVAKYREAMSILPSNKRKKLY